MRYLVRFCLLLSAFVGSLGGLSEAGARGGLGLEDPWAAEHIRELPRDVRSNLTRHEPACGSSRALHSFARYLSHTGAKPQFVALHFELFGCNDRAQVCTASGCLHQVYSAVGSGYRLVFSGYVEELELKIVNGAPAIDISCTPAALHCRRTLLWNGHGFR